MLGLAMHLSDRVGALLVQHPGLISIHPDLKSITPGTGKQAAGKKCRIPIGFGLRLSYF